MGLRFRPLAALLLLTLAGCAPPRHAIVLVTVDTLRADRLGCYGYFRDTSPNLDRLAAEGILFTGALTPMATTLPAHVSLMTSLYPTQHGVRGNFEHLGRSLDTGAGIGTLAEMLRAEGWRTAAFVAATPLKRDSGIAAGFEVFDQPARESRRAGVVVERALDWLDREAERPFLLWLHLWDPHHPYAPPPEFARAFAGRDDIASWMRERGFAGLDDPDVRRQNNDYDDEIRYVDSRIAVLLDGLRARGLYDEATLVVTSDHGEGLGQHGWLRHGRIYQEQLRVPLIMRFPSRLGLNGRRHDGVASLIDVLPTLVGRLDLPIADERRRRLEGIDLLDRAERSRRLVFAERVSRSRAPWEDGDKFALTDGRWKYFHLSEGPDQLFDLAADPHELENVIDRHPEVTARMRARIEELLAELAHSAVDLAGDGLSDERRRELESLGYVE